MKNLKPLENNQIGKLTSQRQNEPDFFTSVYERCKVRVQALERIKALKKKAKNLKTLAQQ